MKDNKVEINKKKRTYAFFYWLLAKVLRKLYRVRVINPENEPLDAGYILASNHMGAADPIIICASFKGQVKFMGKSELFKIPLLGGFLRACGFFPIDRGGSDVGALRTTVDLLKNKNSVGIFAQGTRMPYVNPRTTEVKKGVALISARSGADVLPVCVKSKAGKTKMFRKNYVIIGKLIKNEDFDFENNKGNEGHQRVADRIFNEICNLYDETEI